jgi:hypothetical protein
MKTILGVTIGRYTDAYYLCLPRTFFLYDGKAIAFGHRRADNTAWRVRWAWFKRLLLETFDSEHVRNTWSFTGERPVYHTVRRFGFVDHSYSTFHHEPGYGAVPGTGCPKYESTPWGVE